MENKKTTFEDCVLDDEKKGYITIVSFDGFHTFNFEEFVKQPVDGLLYDLNMNKSTLLTFLADENQQEALKYVNQYAAARVIRKLKEEVDELKSNRRTVEID